MTYRGYVCWNEDQIPRVLNTEALQTDDAVFLSTHQPVRLYKQTLHRTDVREPIDEEAFRDAFLSQPRFAFVPVLGNAGTGKSHLVRWLALNIPESTERKIILIPKGGTNLRDVIRRILVGMKGQRFDDYRERLDHATAGLTEANARETLINHLAVAIGREGDGPRPESFDGTAGEAFGYLADFLPALLLDPHMRTRLLQPDGIIADLVRHAIGSTGTRERLEARRQFSSDDLPHDVAGLEKASEAAQQIYTVLLTDPEIRELAIQWLNLHLDVALGQLLQLAGDDLTRLMREVRAELAQRDMELCLLIEDFAKLQGIERPLLDAVLEQPDQPDMQLCDLRTALACTTDYFMGVEDTVRDRTTFVISLDRKTKATDSIVSQKDLQSLAARYLNAIRLGGDALDSWYASGGRSGDQLVPNACERCDYRERCHAGFGAAESYGLYPFNSSALLQMYDRASATDFNPRLLINDVLKKTLLDYGASVAKGGFPPPTLTSAFGGSRLSAAKNQKIEELDPSHSARRKTFVEFWASGKIANLHPAVHEALALPMLELDEDGPGGGPRVDTGDKGGEEPTPEESDDRGIPRSLAEKLESLNAWQNGSELPQHLTTELRNAVYDALVQYIDWDGELLLRTFFAGSGRPFKRTSIYFRNQATQRAKALVELTIPASDTGFTASTLALQGLLLFQHFEHWDFEWATLSGARYLRAYARLLDICSGAVLDQIRANYGVPDWDPVNAGVEVLALGSRLLGRPQEGEGHGKQVASLFDETVANMDLESRSDTYSKLANVYLDCRQEIVDLVLSRASATKGGSTLVQMIDAARFLQPLDDVSTTCTPTTHIPEDFPTTREFRSLGKLHGALTDDANSALEAEQQRIVALFDRATSAFDWANGSESEAWSAALREAVVAAQEAGVNAGPGPDALEEVVTAFQDVDTEGWRMAVTRIVNSSSISPELMLEIGRHDERIAKAALELIETADAFLGQTEEFVDAKFESLKEAGVADLGETVDSIEGCLQELEVAICSKLSGYADEGQ